jgi:hypothetical protein
MERHPAVSRAALLLLLGCGAMGSAQAHHSYAAFDRCHPFMFSGEIERVAWVNPHVEIAVRTDAGVTYTIVWLNMQQLAREGVARGVLNVGDHIDVSGAKQPEDKLRVIAQVTELTRPADGWHWSRPPQGC